MRDRLKLPYMMCTVAQGGRLLLGVSIWVLLSSLASTAQPRQAPRVAPRCDLYNLNIRYLEIINLERRKVNATAPTAYFDKILLAGTIRHNEEMQVLDSLFHDTANPIAELVGTLLDDDPVTPDKLARLIFRRLQASEGHCEIQESAERTFISVAATAGYYTVRLARAPGGGASQRPRTNRSQ